MNKPNIFKPIIKKDIKNNKEVYCSFLETNTSRKVAKSSNETPLDTINRLVGSGSYIFNIGVLIKTKDKTYDTKIAGKLGNKIITCDSDSILISDIISIKEK